MKAFVPLVCIILALVTAMILHKGKIDNNTEAPQRIAYGLKGIEPYLSPLQFLPIRNLSDDPKNTLYARLLLVPVHADALKPNTHADTILQISPRNLNFRDSLHTRTIWKNAYQDLNFELLTHN